MRSLFDPAPCRARRIAWARAERRDRETGEGGLKGVTLVVCRSWRSQTVGEFVRDAGLARRLLDRHGRHRRLGLWQDPVLQDGWRRDIS